ncbi:erythromycin esterase family protein [Nonomuraea sp. NPDC050556]|uniref:erythromycin esterase family protein n=1 Tax=Nonomuraea sp. NPDC050556 TaxID=3364369 RepID=UPI0037A4CA46
MSEPAIIPLTTLDPAAPLDDLTWLDQVVGDARVVAIGESAHYNAESYLLRHRVLRYLAERHGFSAYAMESGFTEGWLTDGWVRGGDEHTVDEAMGVGMTSLMGFWTQMRGQLEWMRGSGVHYYGVDNPGSNASLLPGIDAITAYLGGDVDPALRETAAIYAAASPFSVMQAIGDYAELPEERRDAVTAMLAELVERTADQKDEPAVQSLRLTASLDAMIREMVRGNPDGAVFGIREVAMADSVEWILRQEGRIVLAAHNGHVQRWPITMPGTAPATTLGMHLAERLGADYVVIGTTTGEGETLNTGPDFYTGKLFTELGPPEEGTLDALMAASRDGAFATDLRRLPPADAKLVEAADRQRLGAVTSPVRALDAYDVLVHLPHVTAADPDAGALACAPAEVQTAFTPT